MTTVPSGEASIPTCGARRASDSPAGDSQGQASLPADGPVANSAGSTEPQDVDLASAKPAASKAAAASGDENQQDDEPAVEHRQEPKEPTAPPAHPAPDALPTSLSLQNLVWAGPVWDSRRTRSLRVSQSDSLVKEETPQTPPDGEQALDPPAPSAEAQFPPNAPAPGTANTDSLLHTWAAGTTEAPEKSEGLEAVNANTEALPSAESPAVSEGDSVHRSTDLLARPGPPSPGSSAPPLPGRRPLDSSLYAASEETAYMRSVTSLLGGGEGSIDSLADILVWSEATMAMATGLLASGHSSVTDLLHSPGPSLRSASSFLGGARSAFSSALVAGTSSVLGSVARALERMEQRAVEGLRSAVCYVTSQLTPL